MSGLLFTRILVVVCGLAIAGLATLLGKLTKSKWELSSKQQVGRYFAAVIAAAGLWIAGSGVMHHPDTGQTLECISLDEAQARRDSEGLPVLIDFTADWCAACHELYDLSLSSDEVMARSDDFICAVIDVTEETPTNLALMEAYGVGSLPHLAFERPDGEIVFDAAIRGFVEQDVILETLGGVADGDAFDGRSRFERTLDERGWIWAFLLVFLGGVGASLTPCVYPLIPITIGVFGAAEAQSRWQGFLLSFVYVNGIAITYSILGVTAAMAGGLFGSALQSPWVLLGFGVLFFVFALSLLGLYDFRVPAAIQDRATTAGGKGYPSALAMGLLAGVIAAPCVGPILSGVLLFIAETRNAALGMGLMFTFAYGMGLLFLVLGTFSSLIHKLPGSGGWMETVKVVFGMLFLVLALHYVSQQLEPLRYAYLSVWDAMMAITGK